MPTEHEYKREFRKLVGVWTEVYETRSGSGTGYPDLQLLIGKILLPVELKRGDVVDGLVKSSAIRPSQISWHHEFFTAGGVALICVCCGPVKAMNVWAIPSTDRETTSKWNQGWKVQTCTQLVASGHLRMSLSSLVSGVTAQPL